MAQLKYCPNCEATREVTKKGFNKAGNQLWICKVCGKKFTEITEPVKRTKLKTKSDSVTDIIVNNNVIKTVTGTLTLDEAFDMVSSYFKEVAKDAATVTHQDNKTIIQFKVTTGGKG